MDNNIINESAEVIQRLKNYNATITLIGGFDVADPVIKEAIQMIAKLTIPLTDEWSGAYTIEDEAKVSPVLTIAKDQGAQFQCTSVVGWIDIETPNRFRYSCTYRYKKVK
jgi:hypothetical protein